MGLKAVMRGPLDTSKPAVRVRLLGGFDLRLGEEGGASLDSARAESLLAYLLLHRDAPQQRQHLAFLFWPDSTEAQARTNLRHVLHNLRRQLPAADELIDIGPRMLQWRPEARVWLDVEAFEQAVAEGRLGDAVETYAGELLDGRYDEWLLEERERLAQLHLDALGGLVQELEERGLLLEAIRYAERLLREDSLREQTYRTLIRLYDASGDHARALRAYHACATSMVRELGVEPSAETREAYEALLRAPDAGALEAAPPPTSAVPLVGRKRERERLAELWRAAESGGAQLLLVSGEAGIGKSRLVEELRSWCAHRGAVTAEARAYAAEGTIAYGVLATWLRSEAVAARFLRIEPAHLTELARVMPELLTHPETPDVRAPEALPETDQRQRLFAAASAALRAAGSPLLLVADDLQWCDAQTLGFVHFLLRAEPQEPVLVAATARREEIDPDQPASELLTSLQALDRLSEITLERLTGTETRQLAEWIAGAPLADDEADRIYEESEGNPLFVVEAVRAGRDAARAEGKVQAVIASRFAQLSRAAAELVGVAATIGREFTAQVLADAADTDEATFVRGLDELWRRGLVRAHGPSAYDFSHAKIREAAYEALGPVKASRHHLRLAKALERRHVADHDAVSGQIAAHYEAAGATREAIPWYARAAEAAQRLHASTDAVRFLERACGLVRELSSGEERDRIELRLLTQLPAPLVAVEGYLSDRVAGVHERALGLARSLGVDPEPPLVRSLALAMLTRGEFERARPLGERLRARAEQASDQALWVESAYVLGLSAYWLGRLDDARQEFETALRRFHPEHRSEHLIRYGQDPESFCRMRLAHTLWLLGREHEAASARDSALVSADRLGHPYSHAAALVFAFLIALDQGDDDRLRSYLDDLRSAPRLAEAGPTRSGAEAFAGYVDLLDGRSEDGIERMRLALTEARRTGPAAPGHLGFLMRVLVEALARAGEADAGVAAADEALAIGGGAQLWEAEIRRLRANFLQPVAGGLEEVEAELVRAIEVAQRQGARPFERRARGDLDRLRTGAP